MRWTPGGRSRNLEDLRGATGGGGGMRMGRGMGVGGTVILLILSLVFGRNFLPGDVGGTPIPAESGDPSAPANESPEEAQLVEFVSFVLDDAQPVWQQKLRAQGEQYREAKLVLFRGAVRSGCGDAESAMGPFYCGNDEKVYLDLGFFDALRSRLGAGGDFAQAYVIAHEIGHHVQNIQGTLGRVNQMQQMRPRDANAFSVRLELQADCYAGVWGHSTGQRRLLESGDIEEGLNAAAAIGDDRLQRQSSGTVRPESFTHGTSEERVRWFRRGLESGDPKSCDTFLQ